MPRIKGEVNLNVDTHRSVIVLFCSAVIARRNISLSSQSSEADSDGDNCRVQVWVVA